MEGVENNVTFDHMLYNNKSCLKFYSCFKLQKFRAVKARLLLGSQRMLSGETGQTMHK